MHMHNTLWNGKSSSRSILHAAFEEDVGGSYFGLAVVKNERRSSNYDGARQGFTSRYNHVVYALGFTITREIYEDDQYDIVGKLKAQSLAFSMRQTKEIIGANVYNRAFNTSYVGGDAATLVACAAGGSATAPNIAGGTYTNGPSPLLTCQKRHWNRLLLISPALPMTVV
jgi:hypothetical protein